MAGGARDGEEVVAPCTHAMAHPPGRPIPRDPRSPVDERVSRKRRYCRREHLRTMTRWIRPSLRWPYLAEHGGNVSNGRAGMWAGG